jgi:hypothetical protein
MKCPECHSEMENFNFEWPKYYQCPLCYEIVNIYPIGDKTMRNDYTGFTWNFLGLSLEFVLFKLLPCVLALYKDSGRTLMFRVESK